MTFRQLALIRGPATGFECWLRCQRVNCDDCPSAVRRECALGVQGVQALQVDAQAAGWRTAGNGGWIRWRAHSTRFERARTSSVSDLAVLWDKTGASLIALEQSIFWAKSPATNTDVQPFRPTQVMPYGSPPGEAADSSTAAVERMKTYVRCMLNATLVCGAFGCSPAPVAPAEAPSSPPAASTTNLSKPAADPASSQPASTGQVTPTENPEPAPASETTTDSGLRKASRPPVELITLPGSLFVFNFGESEVGKAAKERCSASVSTPNEMAECMQKARDKVPVESARFLKKGNDYWWVTLNRYKGNLLKWHVVQFQVGEEKSDRVTLKLVGKDKGIAPMARVPRTLEIELPNDYAIVLNDPDLGKMSYDAKFGKVEE